MVASKGLPKGGQGQSQEQSRDQQREGRTHGRSLSNMGWGEKLKNGLSLVQLTSNQERIQGASV